MTRTVAKQFLTETAETVLTRRYYLKDGQGNVLENWESLCRRVADAVAAPDREREDYEALREQFFRMIYHLDFLPNSPCLMNAGTDLGQLSACFVLPVDDSMDGIFTSIRNGALVHKTGGGTGYSFSRLRPKNSAVRSTQGVASGPLSFAAVFDAATETIKQGGKRRGANMGILRVDHPDIIDFITAKQDQNKFTNFNFSVAITDKFMAAAKNHQEYDLIDPSNRKVVCRMNAAKVFDKIVDLAWHNGEPGVLFIDAANRANATPQLGEFEATNPCIVGDTLVAVADGRGAVAIRQLVEEGKDVPVFCRNSKGGASVRMMRNPRITGYNKQILKVTLDDGNSVRVTENHRFVLSDGSVKEAKDLLSGDSLSLLTKREAPFEKIFSHSNSRSQSYRWLSTTDKPNWQPEHRLIANFHHKQQTGKTIDWLQVVHHRDYNGLNNKPSNLKVMSKEAHYRLHSEERKGDKNPMRLFPEKNWMNDPVKQQELRIKHHVGAKRSPATKDRIGSTTKLRLQDESYRARHAAAIKEGLYLHKDNLLQAVQQRAQQKLEECQSTTDLRCFLDDNTVMVERRCEHCGNLYAVSWSRREQSFCSHACSLAWHNSSQTVRQKITNGIHATYAAKAEQTRRQQVECFLNLKFEQGQTPLKKDWESRCEEKGIPKRLGTAFGFPTFQALKENAQTFNHRVVAVMPDGIEDVYNGTVDEFHNFYIGHFPGEINGDICYSYINNLQCGEQWLLPYESCNLGSINLGQYIKDSTVDYPRLAQTVQTAVRFLDNVIDCNRFPIPEIAEMTRKTRKIGLGIMGLHDMLIQLELSYGDEAGRVESAKVMQFIRDEAEAASIALAELKGPFPAWNPQHNQYIARRNAALTSIQPTGTVSMIADCSSGCEPYFSVVTEKNVMDGTRFLMVNKHFESVAKREGFFSEALLKKVAQCGTVLGHAEIPEKWQRIFLAAQDISPADHIKMQGALQASGVDSSISKTINLPASASKEDVRESYLLGFELGCKGLTVYRDGSREGQVLSTAAKQTATVSSREGTQKQELPDVLSAKRYRLKDANGDRIYIIVCFDDNENPMEVFAKFPFDNRLDLKDKSTMWTTTCRLVSLALRCQIPMEEIISQLDRSSGHMLDLPAQLGRLLKSFMAGTQKGFTSSCPECPGTLLFSEGCEVCRDCGYSRCS
ncbi:ribonucleotide reductase N-terminal alpha domain-containing protein [Candidatus Electronema sp. PJ]|uniref:ribonucleotide reductase N-terminal alpha domain-containing protein n=1 Tax=Candidatus Electronema sp. PJ TaxID=3401572 RepID=UPI003AA8BB98